MTAVFSEAKRLYSKAKEALETLEYPENYEEAELLFREAVRLGSTQPTSPEHVAHTVSFLYLLLDVDKLDEARSIAAKVQASVNDASPAVKAAAWELSAAMARIEMRDGQLNKADAHLIAAIETHPKTGAENNVHKQSLISSLENLQVQMGKGDPKLARLLQRLEEFRPAPLDQPAPYHGVLEQIAAIYISQRKHEAAMNIIEEGRRHLATDWDTSRIRPQRDAMAATVARRKQNN
ncbi:hypothetical protein [Leisingera aquimarina]|uniref:hypothetical protein n=1 Tax=Leisingera aquimarina TaxID=476529 RepID=UPI0004068E19|nr:hypothetical protein [Leisingera aquimarina]